MTAQWPKEQHLLLERSLQLKDKALRLVEPELANKSAGDVDIWTFNGELRVRHHVLSREDFCMSSGEEGAPRVQDLLPVRMIHTIPRPEDFNDETFEFWTNDIGFQNPSDYSTSQFDGERAGAAVFFNHPDYIMEKPDR